MAVPGGSGGKVLARECGTKRLESFEHEVGGLNVTLPTGLPERVSVMYDRVQIERYSQGVPYLYVRPCAGIGSAGHANICHCYTEYPSYAAHVSDCRSLRISRYITTGSISRGRLADHV